MEHVTTEASGFHPAFHVYIEVSHAYEQVDVSQFEKMASVLGAKFGLAEDDTITLASGKTVKRKLSEMPAGTISTIGFNPGGIDIEMKETEDAVKVFESGKDPEATMPQRAGWSFNKFVAHHIETIAMRDHSPRSHWLSIKVPANPELEKYLNFYFEMETAS